MSGTADFPAWIDGRLCAPGTGRVSCDDEGLLLGFAVFETVLFEGGVAWLLERHLARLADGARELGLAPRVDPAAAVREYCAAGAARLRAAHHADTRRRAQEPRCSSARARSCGRPIRAWS